MAAAPAATPTLPTVRYKLQNGLDVVFHEDHRVPIVSVNVFYHVGSKDEPQGKNGFAHLFEHLMFQGSKHVAEDKFFDTLERAGSTDVNGTTNEDRTNYFETVPSNRLELALWLESDRMGYLLSHVDQATFESQRSVVKNERRQNYENAPYGLVSQFIHEAMYPVSHPYHRLTIGTPEDLDRATLDDVRNFFQTWYVPNNASLVIAGDIDKDKALGLVKKYFEPIPSRPLPARYKVPPVDIEKNKELQIAASVELARVYAVWPTPALYAEGDADLDLAAHVLSSGKGSRLYKKLVHDLQWAQDVSAHQSSSQLGGSFWINATVRDPSKAREVLAVIDAEVAKLAQEGATEDELARAKTSTLSSFTFGLEKMTSRANTLNGYMHHTNNPDFLSEDIGRYQKATRATVQKVTTSYLASAKRVVAFVNPDKQAPLAGKVVSIGGAR